MVIEFNDVDTELDLLRKDLKFQLGCIDDLDFDYFLRVAVRAKLQADIEGRNMSEINSQDCIELVREVVAENNG